MSNTQTLTRDTPMGPREAEAPSGWEFDKTSTLVWCKMLDIARELRNPPRRQQKYKRLAHEASLEVLGNILANSLGIAGFYWTQAARLFSKDEA